MNSNQVEQFILAVGALSELWTVTYKNFKDHGFDHAEALEHTAKFIETLLKTKS